MKLERMLSMCRAGQWSVDDLDWSVRPRALTREQELAVCQYFTNMSGIELLAAALFEVQRDATDDPLLAEIFDTFVTDERRHAEVARRLAAHYDVHGLRRYAVNPHLERFRGPFLDVLHRVGPDIANAYITTGELLLDVALLRSLNDYVNDDMSSQAMTRINRDESRHIAIDFYMVEYYSSPEFVALAASQPARSLVEALRAAVAMIVMLYRASPFLREVFFEPLDLTDPSGKRMLEAFKRVQLLARKPQVAARPFTRFLRTMQDLYNHPVLGRALEPLLRRAIGLDPRVIVDLYTPEELRRAQRMSIQEMAQEALQLKFAT